MTNEEQIQQAVTEKCGIPADKIRIQRARRIWVNVEPDQFDRVLEFLNKEQKFVILCTITGLDEGEKITIIYHLAQMGGIMLNLNVGIPKDKPVWKSVHPYFNGCAIYEREIKDLLGVTFEGIPPGSRYPLPDGWPEGEYPLRKDWKSKQEQEAASKEAP